MRAPHRSNGQAQRVSLPQQSLDAYERGFAELEDEDTVAYDARQTPPVALPALQAECLDAQAPKAASASVESNVHRVAPRSAPPEAQELDRWFGAFSEAPPTLPPAPVLPRPSPTRSFFAKFLFVIVVAAVLLLVAMEISVLRQLPWLDPRPLLVKLWGLVTHEIP
jgi:hypothetical protein